MQNMKIGDHITKIKKQLKLLQAEIWQEVGRSRRIIGRYIRDDISPSICIAIKVADALNDSLDYANWDNMAHFDKKIYM